MEDILVELLTGAELPLMAAFGTLVTSIVKRLVPNLPTEKIPALLPILGGLLLGVGKAFGIDLDLHVLQDASAFEAGLIGVLVGMGSTGMHQIVKQRRKAAEASDE
jgi:uncharacterized protein (DUF697 family)